MHCVLFCVSGFGFVFWVLFIFLHRYIILHLGFISVYGTRFWYSYVASVNNRCSKHRVSARCGFAQVAMALVRYATPIILSLGPVVERDGNVYRCLLCGQTFSGGGGAQVLISTHVNISHSDYLDRATIYVISRLWGALNGGGR